MEGCHVLSSQGGTAKEQVADAALETKVPCAGTASNIQQVELQVIKSVRLMTLERPLTKCVVWYVS